jgi:hypothetical protein
VPIVQVFCPPAADIEPRLADVCREVAAALHLGPSDVIATHVPVGRTVRPGHDLDSWPVVTVHSSPRPEADVRRAVAALQQLADGWAAGSGAGWVTWLERQ